MWGVLSPCTLAEELQLYCESAYHNKIWIIVLRNPSSSSPPSSNSAHHLSLVPSHTSEKYQMISAISSPSNYNLMSRNPNYLNQNPYPANTTNFSARITHSAWKMTPSDKSHLAHPSILPPTPSAVKCLLRASMSRRRKFNLPTSSSVLKTLRFRSSKNSSMKKYDRIPGRKLKTQRRYSCLWG